MRQFLTSAAAVVLGLAVAGVAHADKGGKGGGGSHPGPSSGPKIGNVANGPQGVKPPGNLAKGPKNIDNPTKGDFGKFKDYHLTHATKFDKGYCYKGKWHDHWQCTCWRPDYGCNLYFCPSVRVWYYWCEPDDCYYPVDYCPYGTFVFTVKVVRPVHVVVLP